MDWDGGHRHRSTNFTHGVLWPCPHSICKYGTVSVFALTRWTVHLSELSNTNGSRVWVFLCCCITSCIYLYPIMSLCVLHCVFLFVSKNPDQESIKITTNDANAGGHPLVGDDTVEFGPGVLCPAGSGVGYKDEKGRNEWNCWCNEGSFANHSHIMQLRDNSDTVYGMHALQ